MWWKVIAVGAAAAMLTAVSGGACAQSPSPQVQAALAELERDAPPRELERRGVQLAATALSSQLEWRIAVDQYWRSAGFAKISELAEPDDRRAMGNLVARKMVEIDELNTAWLKEMIASRGGWPLISEVGAQDSSSLWLIAQHADRDPDFQKEVLALLEPLVALGEASKSNFAYLYDRVAVADGRSQRYGTQGRCIDGEGRWEAMTIETPAMVDSLRAEVGLPPMADYVARFAKMDVCR